jgi:hypothetical protein
MNVLRASRVEGPLAFVLVGAEAEGKLRPERHRDAHDTQSAHAWSSPSLEPRDHALAYASPLCQATLRHSSLVAAMTKPHPNQLQLGRRNLVRSRSRSFEGVRHDDIKASSRYRWMAYRLIAPHPVVISELLIPRLDSHMGSRVPPAGSSATDPAT